MSEMRLQNVFIEHLADDGEGVIDESKYGVKKSVDKKSCGTTAQGGPWPSQAAFSRPAFFLPVFSNS
ncbi:hypothetical protein TNCV_2904581 [Trichonephila clavipes]|nr:hypothetical protein TNCV_2904581 [Trichonephila clavipes]